MNGSAPSPGWRRHVAAWSAHRYGTWLVAAVAFADSSFLPLPPDLLLVPMCLMRPERIRFLLVLCTLASALGALFGYLIGYELWSVIGARLVAFYGYEHAFAAYQGLFARWGVAIIIVKGFTPIPFKIAAIAAGVAAMNPLSFIVAAILGRALHFAMLGWLLTMFGGRLAEFVARYERRLAILSLLVVIGGAVVYCLR